ncbi:MAG: hypothetical protein KDJ34_03975 [Candidatus Competibacteraceae bacterium]|nr:hypothetical protein [Candidatus Competibacteraceae bacterium]
MKKMTDEERNRYLSEFRANTELQQEFGNADVYAHYRHAEIMGYAKSTATRFIQNPPQQHDSLIAITRDRPTQRPLKPMGISDKEKNRYLC